MARVESIIITIITITTITITTITIKATRVVVAAERRVQRVVIKPTLYIFYDIFRIHHKI